MTRGSARVARPHADLRYALWAHRLLHSARMDLAIYDAPDLIAAIWQRLEAVARPPYAQSWGWIENWLSSLDVKPPLTVIHDDAGDPIAAAFDDMPVLRAPSFPALGLTTSEFRATVERELATPHVDLETVRAVEGGYISTRPAVIRAGLMHARLQAGELDVESATDAPRAHAFMDELLDLKGAPDSPTFRRLIDQRAPFGEMQVLRVCAGDETLGCFFNVTWHDHVAYQLTAFASASDADLCHAAAIEHNAAHGFAFYELHPDDVRLATGETRHVVLRLQRRTSQGMFSRLAG